MPSDHDDWFTCPVCGEVVQGEALACPHCGADDETGWNEDAAYDEVDLPDEAFGDEPARTRQQNKWFGYVTIGLIIVFILVYVL